MNQSKPIDRKRVVICGGGAGGLQLAVALAKRRDLDVHLVEPCPTHIWKPLLHEIASGSLEAGTHEISYLALARWRGFRFAQGRLRCVDRARREVVVGPLLDKDGIEIIPVRRLPYDLLVLAVGGVTNTFGIAGVENYCYLLDTVEDAERIHAHIVRACMQANYGTGRPPVRAFEVCIVGGGATGVELAAELRSTTRMLTAFGLDQLDPDKFLRLTIVNADQRLVQQLSPRIAEAVAKTLDQLGVLVRNGEQVVAVEQGALVTRSGERISFDLAVWAAGVKGPDFLQVSGFATNRLSQILVGPTLQTTTDPTVFAMGDCAAAPWPGHGTPVPPRAQAAQQQAGYLSRAIPELLNGTTPRPFSYNDLGSLISIGSEGGIGTLMGFIRGAGFQIEGVIASLLYRYLYKKHLAGLFGWWTVMLDSLGRWMGSRTRPQVKLH